MKILNILLATGIVTCAGSASIQAEGMKAGALDKLTAATSFTIKAERSISKELAEETPFPEKSSIEIHVVRPDKVHLKVTGDEVDRQLFFDGKEVSYVDAKENVFFTFPAAGDIDALIAAIEEELGFSLPMADLISSDPKSKIMAEGMKIQDLGERELDGAKFSFVKGSDEEIHWHAWIDQATKTLKKVDIGVVGQDEPAMVYDFKEFILEADHSGTQFTFTPVEGVKVAKVITVSEMAVGTVEGEKPKAE